MKQVARAGLLWTTLLLTSCQLFLKDEYSTLISSSSVTKKVYSGFQQAFEATVTPMDRMITQAVLDRKAQMQEWSPAQLETALRQANDERLTQSKFFIRLFTPEVMYNDLHQPDSIWKVYLVLGEQKFEGNIRRDFSKLAELQALYPYFDRFSFGYDVSFPVGQATLANAPYQILMTGSLGKAEFNFN